MHKPLQIKDLDLSFPHKICFESFSCQVPYGSRIAIIGRNGSGKSTVLKKIVHLCPKDVILGYVPQVIEGYGSLSGGELLNKAVTEALSLKPSILLLDEPTNHLDSRNQKNLRRMLQHYAGTLIVVSHDKELLRHCIETLWHIDNGKIHIFSGHYEDYIHEMKRQRTSVENEWASLRRQKKDLHHKLMQEQQRAAKSKSKGEKKVEKRKWLKMVGDLKGMKAEQSWGKKMKNIEATKHDLTHRLADLRLPEVIIPQFSLEPGKTNKGIRIQISDGAIGYTKDKPLLGGITLNLYGRERIALTGDNGSGKSTLIKALFGDKHIHKTGEWYGINCEDMGYLDQHYRTLSPDKSVLETLSDLVPHWSHAAIRSHLNDFLFRKNEEVMALVRTLSEGEKARLSLAQIAAKTPKLLLLDEITNNLDLETKEHVTQVLKAYPGAMVIISHEVDFLEAIGINERIDVTSFRF